MSSPLSSESVFRGGLGGFGTPRFTYAPPGGPSPSSPPWAQLCTLQARFWSALAHYGTTFREGTSKMVVSGASSQALAAARARLSFSARIFLWSQFWINFGPPNGSQHLMMPTCGPLQLNLGDYWERLSVRSRGSCAKSGHSWPQTCPKSYANQIFAAFGALTWAYSACLP